MKICPVCSTEYPDDVKFCPNDGQTLRSAGPAANLVGQVVADRYHVVKKLGEGGMGQVYLAEHVKMGRRSAIKVMNPSMVHDPDAVARFNREASNASRITHPNVCAIYDFGETPDGLIYLAMEFIEGEPLTDALERDGALPVPRAVNIFLQTADALQAAHDLGIVHRDLKPDNIMLTRKKSGGDVVKVVDFGIAKAVGGDQQGQKVTKTGLVVGTPEFMSPEQLSGDTVDGRSDLYSLALVFYRMLTGKLPFEAATSQEVMIKRLIEEPAKLLQTRPDLTFPAGLQAVIDTALARSPVDRYQTVAKFAADVASVAGRPVSGAVPHTRSGSADTEGKTQLLDTSAGVTTRISAKRATPSAPAPAKKRSFMPVAAGVVVILAAGGAWMALNGGSKTGGNPNPVDTSHVSRDTAKPAGERHVVPPLSLRYDDAAGARALDHLVDEMDNLPGDQLVDSAKAIYRASSPGAAKGNAAYMTAQLYLLKVQDLQAAREWINTALQQVPGNQKYGDLRTAINRDLGRP